MSPGGSLRACSLRLIIKLLLIDAGLLVCRISREKAENLKTSMVSTGRNIGTITQELQYPFAGTGVHFQQDSSPLDGTDEAWGVFNILEE